MCRAVYRQTGGLSEVMQCCLLSAYYTPSCGPVAREAVMNKADDLSPALVEFIGWGEGQSITVQSKIVISVLKEENGVLRGGRARLGMIASF